MLRVAQLHRDLPESSSSFFVVIKHVLAEVHVAVRDQVVVFVAFLVDKQAALTHRLSPVRQQKLVVDHLLRVHVHNSVVLCRRVV